MENYYDERSHIDKAFQNWNGAYWVQGCRIGTSIPTRCSAGRQGPCGTMPTRTPARRSRHARVGTQLPDQWSKHNAQDSGYGGEAIAEMTRWDWAEDLLEWFDYYLKGEGRSRICMPKSSATTGSGASNHPGLRATLNPHRSTSPSARPTAVGWAELRWPVEACNPSPLNAPRSATKTSTSPACRPFTSKSARRTTAGRFSLNSKTLRPASDSVTPPWTCGTMPVDMNLRRSRRAAL